MLEKITISIKKSAFGSFYAIEKHLDLVAGKDTLKSLIKRKIKDVAKTNEIFKLFGYEIIIQKIESDKQNCK